MRPPGRVPGRAPPCGATVLPGGLPSGREEEGPRRRWAEARMERLGSNGSCPGCGRDGGPSARAATALAAVLIFTIVVDVLGNALVILSVLRNKKLRNAGERGAGAGGGAAVLPTCRRRAGRSGTAPRLGLRRPGPAQQPLRVPSGAGACGVGG